MLTKDNNINMVRKLAAMLRHKSGISGTPSSVRFSLCTRRSHNGHDHRGRAVTSRAEVRLDFIDISGRENINKLTPDPLLVLATRHRLRMVKLDVPVILESAKKAVLRFNSGLLRLFDLCSVKEMPPLTKVPLDDFSKVRPVGRISNNTVLLIRRFTDIDNLQIPASGTT